MGFLSDAFDTVTGFLGGTDEQTTTSTKSLAPLDTDSQAIWDDFMSSYKNLFSNLKGKQASDTGAFNTYKSALTKAGDTYGSTISALMNSISSGKNDLGFSLGGGNMATFTPKSVRENASTMADLAGKSYENTLVVPTAQYGFDTTTNDYTTNLNYYNILASLAKDIKDRQMQLATTTSKTADTSQAGLNDVLSATSDALTSLKNLGGQFSGLGFSIPGLPNIGLG